MKNAGKLGIMIRMTRQIVPREDADCCFLGGVLPVDLKASRCQQARSCFEQLESGLKQAGMEFGNVVRTWFYLDHLLEWYEQFNEVRTTFFRERNVFENLVPASTGIGAGNAAGAAVVASALAIRPGNNRVEIFAVPSPLQCSALDYHSAFSRAVEIQWETGKQLLISGTASIAPGGQSLHRDDAAGQIELTMRVVGEILHSRGMDWRDTTRAIAYFKDLKDVPHFTAWREKNGMKEIPVTITKGDICRPELLFELELDAAIRRGP
jgi:enamine deaminase RidA (YjgF/YER057c/UK114 family)